MIYSVLNTHTHNCFTALFLGPPGWTGARRELLDFMVQGEINRGRHTNHPAGCHSIWTVLNQVKKNLKYSKMNFYCCYFCMIVVRVREIEFKDCQVQWHGVDDVYFFQQKSPSKFYRAISRAFRITKSSGFVLIMLLFCLLWKNVSWLCAFSILWLGQAYFTWHCLIFVNLW